MIGCQDDAGANVLLALDQGGGSSRAFLWAEDGRLLAVARRPVSEQRHSVERIEQDPEELVTSLRQVIGEVLREGFVPGAAGLATQRSSLLFWDRHSGQSLSPVFSWQDTRAAGELEDLLREPGIAEEIHRRTGLRASPHYGASKIAWGLRHLPAVRQALAEGRLASGPLVSFLVQRLTRERLLIADVANASRTLLWNLHEGRWDPDLLALFQIPEEILPQVVPTTAPHGTLEDGGAALRVITGDQGATLFAAGPADPTAAWINLGTGAFLQRPLRQRSDPPAGLLLGAVADLDDGPVWAHEASVNGCGSALRAYADQLGKPSLEDLSRWLDAVADPPLFLNGVSGLASPFWRADFPSSFVDDGSSDSASRAVAILESVVFLLGENLDRLDAVDPPHRLVVTGGLARLDGLCWRLAALSNRPVDRPDLAEATARGTACLAAGLPHWPLAVRRFRAPRDVALQERRKRWRQALGDALGNGSAG